MKRLLGISSFLGGSAAVVLAAQPVWAQQATQITDVKLNQTPAGVEILLETQAGDRPQVFTVTRDNSSISDLINTQLSLPDGNGFLQSNPAPGISAISVSQLDSNSVRLTVTGASDIPVGQVRQATEGLLFTFDGTSDGGNNTVAQTPPPQTIPTPPPATTQAPTNVPTSPSPVAQNPTAQITSPDVLVPNPEVFVDGVPLLNPNPTYTPPLQPRAIAPPLGDIAVSTIDTALDTIELDTTEVVPRLVLRDAPVRDVLSLLARAAGLNIAYIGDDPSGGNNQQQPQAGAADTEIRISLDIENEPVQDVFNYVLRLANLEANRSGRTIFVGPRLPDEARNVIARTLRMNQVEAETAANFLATQGAEARILFEPVQIQTFGDGAAARIVEVREPPQIVPIEAQEGLGPLLLRGLSVTSDDRLNAITLVGTPRQIQIAMDLLAQLDLRQRQVAVNVKVIDVNLLATEDFSTSFSFGIGEGFFVSDGGAASFLYGDVRPPGRGDLDASIFNPAITSDFYPDGFDGSPFFDAQPDAPYSQSDFGDSTGDAIPTFPFETTIQEILPDGTIEERDVVIQVEDPRFPFGRRPRPPFGTATNPLQPGITEVQDDGIEVGLPSLFQYPTSFLLDLQAQVVSGNAKILTDPTLTVQEGSEARVQLTTEVFGGFDSEGEPIIKDAGLILNVAVERIDDNGFVTLAVTPTVSSVAQVFNTRQGDIVLLQERTVSSPRIRLRDGQTLILAGIIQDSDRVEVSKVPILGDIPILGALFRSTSRENARQEVIVLVTPQILDDSDLSNFGYRYSPGADVQRILQEQGIPLQ